MATRSVEVDIRSNATRFAASMAQAARSLVGVGSAANRSSRQLESTERQLQRIRQAASRAQGAFAGYISVQALRRLGQFTNSVIATSTSLVEQAQAVGVASDELEVFQRALRGDGATVEQINQGLSQLTRNIGLAAQGTGTAGAIFEQYGISIMNADGSIRSSLAVYRDLVTALADVSPAARAAGLGLTIGEEAARTFAASVARGGEALAEAERRERSFGLASEEANQTLKDLGDTVRTVTDSIDTLARVILANLGDEISAVASRFREYLGALIAFEQNTGGISERFREFSRRIRDFATTLLGLSRVFSLVFSAAVAARIFSVVRALGALAATSLAVTAPISGLTLAIAAFVAVVGGAYIFQTIERLRGAFDDLFAPIQGISRFSSEFSAASVAFTAAFGRLNSAFTELADESPERAAQFEDRIRNINRQYREYQEVLQAIVDTGDSAAIAQARQVGTDLLLQLRQDATEIANEISPEVVPTPPSQASLQELDREIRRGIAELQQEPLTFDFDIRPSFTGVEESITMFGNLRRELRDTSNEVNFLTARLDNTDFVAGLNAAFLDAADAVELLRARLEELVASGALSSEAADDLLSRYTDLGEEMNLVAEFAAQAGTNIADSFADAILQAESLSDVLDSLVETLLRIAVQSFIGRPLADLFAGFFATGGRIPGGQFGVVGERGPELISGPANITPLDAGMLAGGGQINVDVRVEGDPNPEFTQAAAMSGAREALNQALGDRNIRQAFGR